jgi:hypothetical protein
VDKVPSAVCPESGTWQDDQPCHAGVIHLMVVLQVNGFVTGYGSPHWKASHPAAEATAPAVKVRAQDIAMQEQLYT